LEILNKRLKPTMCKTFFIKLPVYFVKELTTKFAPSNVGVTKP